MNVFFFVFDAVPTDASRETHDIAGAKAHVFAVAADMAQAEVMACSHVMDYGWRTTGTEHRLQLTREQLAALEEPEASLHRKALRQGVAAFFYAWPKVQRDENDPAEVRSLGSPILDTKRAH